MSWPIKEISIVDLNLDQHNIRTPISDKDQNALIRDMFANEEAFEIVKSYVQNDVFPDEFPIAVKENGKMVVIEGNRRLAALKALNMPEIVSSWKRKIKALRNPKITKINVVVAPNRDAAIRHIANKHTINYRRAWKPLRQAYFYKSQIEDGKSIEDLISKFPEHNVPRFFKMIEMHHIAKSLDVHESLIPKIHDDRNFPITNLERFYNDKKVVNFLGIEFDQAGRVRGKVAKKEFEKGYKRIIEDIATGIIDSRKYNTVGERADYIKRIVKKDKPDLKKRGSFGSKDFNEISQPAKKSKKKKARSKGVPRGLFYQSDVPFRISSTPLKLIYDELRNIDVATFPNATHDLLRSFLECALVFYLKGTGEYAKIQKNARHNPSLSEMLDFVSKIKCKSVTDNNIKQTIKQVKSHWGSPYSLERMNMINHNENWFSTEKEVRAAWGKIEGLFKILLNPGN